MLLIVTAQWMLIAPIFSSLSWFLHSPLWSIKYTSHPGQPPIQHILIFLLHISFSPLPSLSALEDAVMVLLSHFVPFMLGVQ